MLLALPPQRGDAPAGSLTIGDRVARPTPQSSFGGLPYAFGIGGGLSGGQPSGRDTGDAPEEPPQRGDRGSSSAFKRNVPWSIPVAERG